MAIMPFSYEGGEHSIGLVQVYCILVTRGTKPIVWERILLYFFGFNFLLACSKDSETEEETISIPMIAKDNIVESLLLMYQEVQSDSESQETYTIESNLWMAIGEGYPDALTVSIETITSSMCGSLEGELILEEIESSMINVQVLDTAIFSISNIPEGENQVVIRGFFQPSLNDIENCGGIFRETIETNIELHYTIHRESPNGIERTINWQCEGSPRDTLIAGTKILDLGLFVEFEGGAKSQPDNAQSTHPIEVSVTGPSGLYLEDDTQGISSLQLGPLSGQLSIDAGIGEALSFDIIEVGKILDWMPAFELSGLASGGMDLVNGESYGENGWNRRTNQIIPVLNDLLNSNGHKLCSHLEMTWFQLISETPETCVINDSQPEILEVYGEPVGVSASMIADGECRLILSAPNFNQGNGLQTRLNVTIYNVDELVQP